MENPRAANSGPSGPSGFGLGLLLSERLLARFGWTLARTETPERVRLSVRGRDNRLSPFHPEGWNPSL